MLYLICIMIPSVDLAHYGVSHAKDWVSVDCGTVQTYFSTPLKCEQENKKKKEPKNSK